MISCMRYLRMDDLREINRMTLWEYDLRIRAFNLRQIDHEHDLHLAAWLNREAQAKKKKGKNSLQYVYKTFKEFFDFDSRVSKASGKKPENKPMTAAQRAAEYTRRKKNGEL